MPKLSLVLGRRTIGVYDLRQPSILVGRAEDQDIVIDNVSVSREHAKIFRTEDGWSVRDNGSANGTFVNGDPLQGDRPLQPGDEISIGKFSLFFDKVVGDVEPAAEEAKARTAGPGAGASGTMYIKPGDVKEMLASYAETRRAHLAWKAGGKDGTYPLTDAHTVVVGQSVLCDLRVPRGPKQHLLVVRGRSGWEVRNLALFQKMKVDGSTTSRARLSDGTVVEMGGLHLTFVDELD